MSYLQHRRSAYGRAFSDVGLSLQLLGREALIEVKIAWALIFVPLIVALLWFSRTLLRSAYLVRKAACWIGYAARGRDGFRFVEESRQ